MYQEDSFKTRQVVYAHTRSDEADMEYKMHCHNSYEIYYMVKGNVEYFLDGGVDMLLSLKNLQKNYPGFSLDVSMEIEEGQITGLIGANGAGKSTTFKVILGLVHSDAGEIRLFNKDMEQISKKEKADIGATLSDSGFSNCLTVKQIVHILTETYEKFDRRCLRSGAACFPSPWIRTKRVFHRNESKVKSADSHQL